MIRAVLALIGIILLFLAAFGVTAGRCRLDLLGAAFLATALFWVELTAMGG